MTAMRGHRRKNPARSSHPLDHRVCLADLVACPLARGIAAARTLGATHHVEVRVRQSRLGEEPIVQVLIVLGIEDDEGADAPWQRRPGVSLRLER